MRSNALTSVFGIRSEAGLRYTVLRTNGVFEIRLYQRALLGKIIVPGLFEAAAKAGIPAIREYLSGSNFKAIKMELRSPVFQTSRGGGWEISFLLPAGSEISTLPKPVNRSIKFETIPSKKVAVMSFKGMNTEERIVERTADLVEWVKRQNLTPGEVRSVRYDPRFSIPFLKKNEVQIDVT